MTSYVAFIIAALTNRIALMDEPGVTFRAKATFVIIRRRCEEGASDAEVRALLLQKADWLRRGIGTPEVRSADGQAGDLLDTIRCRAEVVAG